MLMFSFAAELSRLRSLYYGLAVFFGAHYGSLTSMQHRQ
jgi:hypothetical protein